MYWLTEISVYRGHGEVLWTPLLDNVWRISILTKHTFFTTKQSLCFLCCAVKRSPIEMQSILLWVALISWNVCQSGKCIYLVDLVVTFRKSFVIFSSLRSIWCRNGCQGNWNQFFRCMLCSSSGSYLPIHLGVSAENGSSRSALTVLIGSNSRHDCHGDFTNWHWGVQYIEVQ